MNAIDLTSVPVGPTEFGQWAALNGPLGLDAFGVNVVEAAPDDELESAHDEARERTAGALRRHLGTRALHGRRRDPRRRPGHGRGRRRPGPEARLPGPRAGHARALRRRAAAGHADALGLLDQRRRAVSSRSGVGPVEPADEARAGRDDALSAARGAHHGDPRPGALQDERDRAAIGRVDRELEERAPPRSDAQSGCAPRPSAPTTQMPMRPLASKPMNAMRRPSGENDGCAAKRAVTSGRAACRRLPIAQSALRPFV